MIFLRPKDLSSKLRNSNLREIWVLLDKRDRFVLKLVILTQVLLSVLDLIGIEGLTFQNQVIVLSSLTISILLTKTVASLWITKRSL
jgi:hypothetical protein